MSTVLVNINNLRIDGKNLIGDLYYIPKNINVYDYYFTGKDKVELDKFNFAFIEMDYDELLDIAYML